MLCRELLRREVSLAQTIRTSHQYHKRSAELCSVN
jgi:hypothetical protein